MKKLCGVVALTVLIAGCNQGQPQEAQTEAEAPGAAAFTPEPHANLAQLMRGIPFPASNIIFDAQSEDPGAAREPADTSGGATATYSNVYGGWQAVENAALALSETANLIMIPGRMCENGRPAPIENEDYRKYAANLAVAGEAALKAAQSKNLDAMVEVAGTVSEACAMCHEVYRDKDDLKDRCIP
jgi:hypothetical protein